MIMFEEQAYFKLIEELGDMVESAIKKAKVQKKWLTKEQAMLELGEVSKSTLQKYRDDNEIEYTQKDKNDKIILYCRKSIDDFLERRRVRRVA